MMLLASRLGLSGPAHARLRPLGSGSPVEPEVVAAFHLLKSCQFWSDAALGDLEFCHIRDKEKREVDFCVLLDGKPWLLVECKTGESEVSPSLKRFASAFKTPSNA